jgi:hypothetical protein
MPGVTAAMMVGFALKLFEREGIRPDTTRYCGRNASQQRNDYVMTARYVGYEWRRRTSYLYNCPFRAMFIRVLA